MDIPHERKVNFALYKLSQYALSWWEQILSHRIQRGKDKICSWPRMLRCLPLNFFPLDYEVILSYTKKDYWPKSSYLRNYIDKLYIQPSIVDITLLVNNIEPTFEDFEVVEEDQVSQQVDEFKLIHNKKLMKKSKRRKLS